MDMDHPTALRGFDSYEVKLGDELRGHRATLGKSLLDVQRELRIKAAYIDAIENCDGSVVPNKGFVPGYVRAYARYLGLDAEEVYARFCYESGFVGQTTKAAAPGAAPRGGFRLGGASGGAMLRDPALSRSYFASPIGRARPVGLGVSLSDIASVAVLAALVGGLGFGAWKLVEDIQRVEFAPADDAPQVAEAPANVTLPGLAVQAAPSWPAVDEDAQDRETALAELYAPPEVSPPPAPLRDGPIAAIDPERSGLYAEAEPHRPTPVATDEAPMPTPAPQPAPAPEVASVLSFSNDLGGSAPAADALPERGRLVAAVDPGAALRAAASVEGETRPASVAAGEGVWIVASAPAWVQVKGRDGSILMQRILESGERWQVPLDEAGARLRAGNAGGVWLQAGGALHGPLGRPGEVVKNVALDPGAVTQTWPEARAETAARD